MLGILSTIFVLGTGILIHEIGHFIAARRFGILCHEFAIGMGPAIYKKKIGETVYSLRMIPIGGYVLMAGEDAEKEMVKAGQEISLRLTAGGKADRIYLSPQEGMLSGKLTEVDLYEGLTLSLEEGDGHVRCFEVMDDAFYVSKDGSTQQIAPRNRCLESKSKLQRTIVLAAGALMNFVLAFVFVFAVGIFQGEPVITGQLASVEPGRPAYEAGLQPGDQIVLYGGTEVVDGMNIHGLIREHTEPLEIEFYRDGVRETTLITPAIIDTPNGPAGQIGVSLTPIYNRSLGYAVHFAVNQYRHLFAQMAMTFEMLFITREAGVGDLSGPVGIYMMTAEVITHGIFPLLILAALINVNLGLLNLLPLPALDGGRIIFILIEAIARRPVPRRFEGYVHMVGFLMFMGLIAFVFFNDIARIIG